MNPPVVAPASDTAALIRERLAALEPELVEIYDESGEHVGHAGAQSGGGHYQLTIVLRALLLSSAIFVSCWIISSASPA